MAETDMLIAEINKKRGEEFSKQLNAFKDFKKAMQKAGVYQEEKYDVPLMHRIECFVK